jgi:hypothetical protein
VGLEEKGAVRKVQSSIGPDNVSGRESAGCVPRWLLRCGYAITFVIVAFSLLLDSSLVKLVKYNRSDLLMLACEMLTETGPKFQDSAKRHAELLRQFKANIENRQLAGILASLPIYSKYSPEKGIDAALATLNSVEGNDIRENAIAVWKAGEQLMQFREDTASLYRRIGSYTPERITKELLKKIEDANVVSGKALARFREKKDLFRAWSVCECNRETILPLFECRAEFDFNDEDAEKFKKVAEQFQKITEESAKIKREWAKTLDPGTERTLFEWFAQSEERRCKIVKAMQDKKMDEANQLMWEYIDRAIQNREKVLEMALKFEDKTQSWKQPKL